MTRHRSSSPVPIPLDVMAELVVEPPLLLANSCDVDDPRLDPFRWCELRSDPEIPPGHARLLVGHAADRWRAEHP